jgi:acyl-CoA thioesterase I
MRFLLFAVLLTVFACNNSTETTTSKTAETAQTPVSNKKNILFFGNSLTAGYGLDDLSEGWVSLLQLRLDSMKLSYNCINAGVSGETTSGGAERVAWAIEQQPVDIFVLELGGNDALRGLKPEESVKNLQTIIDAVRTKYPSVKIILTGMEAPRNLGKTYTDAFSAMYPNLAKKNNIALVPFILEGVGGIPSLNQKDGIHPTPEGNKIMVETVWKVLKTVIQ